MKVSLSNPYLELPKGWLIVRTENDPSKNDVRWYAMGPSGRCRGPFLDYDSALSAARDCGPACVRALPWGV